MAGEFDHLPAWLRPVAELGRRVGPADFATALPPDGGGRPSAVLLLFGEGPEGPDLLLIERAHTLRSHAGQPAFPGGAIDADDSGPVAAALRETVEETGLDPSGVEVFGTLPALYLPPSGYVVTPVMAWWRSPSPVRVVDPREVASVHRVPLAALLDPKNRFRVRHPSGFVGPAFGVAGLIVWGFTAGVLDRLFALTGWERPWDRTRVVDLPARLVHLDRPVSDPAGPAADAAERVRGEATSEDTRGRDERRHGRMEGDDAAKPADQDPPWRGGMP
ncbi:NUDIX domain-containing protein [Thermasporomyces composti]|uniref:NUDIX domain-containing protein n=1 Tax=Thermasporomyces composti TaxID=696763 RepID=A0A3D9VCN3_THECX|nr:NUDIX domain-containing protein [Thermasporomyces composti]